ncbi:MAG: CPBP family intramembrane metalloprotease [Actinomycetota bacterium]|nr:CPBP family intramembrane metalloprotease [Actinomycetota bacterium]
MSQSIALRRSSLDAALLAGLLLLVPLRLMLLGSTVSRTAILFACYVTILALSISATTKRPVVRRLHPALAIALGAAALLTSTALSVPIPARVLAITTLLLGTAAAVSEEALFRGLLYRRFERFGATVAVVVSAVIFAAIHIPLYGTSAWWVDLAAGLLFGWQRWATGSWGASAATHAFANVLAVVR